MNKTLQHSDKSKAKHADTQPDAGLHLFQQDVGRDLEEDVRDEEDDKGCVVAVVSVEVKFLAKAKDIGVGNVDSIQKGQQVHDAQKWDDMEIYLGNEFGVGGGGRTSDMFRVIVVVVVVARKGIMLVQIRGRWVFCKWSDCGSSTNRCTCIVAKRAMSRANNDQKGWRLICRGTSLVDEE